MMKSEEKDREKEIEGKPSRKEGAVHALPINEQVFVFVLAIGDLEQATSGTLASTALESMSRGFY